MEFWGVEVKPGQTVYCDPDEDLIHISQVALGETNKGSVSILVSAKIGDKKVVIGTLSAENHPQILCDLVFERQFELSHSSKTASVFVCGFKILMPDIAESDSSEDEGEVETVNNQVTNPIVDNVVKPPTTKDDKKVADNPDSGEDDSDFSSTDSDDYSTDDEYSSLDDLSGEDYTNSDDTSSEEMDTSSEEDSGDEEAKDTPKPEDGKKTVAETALKTPASDDTSSKEDSSDEEEKNTPKPEDGKKRAAETALKTPASHKKAKIETPSGQDTDDKKVVHVATPHPAKQAGKAPGNSKPNGKSSKYVGGAHACKSCSRTFGSDSALQSHEKAKHA